PSIGLLIVEGEKKSLAANQHGFPCVGLVGVYGWQRKRPKGADGKAEGPRELIADLEAATWPGRPVFVVFDSDVAINKDVGLAEYHLALTLRRHGARAFAVRLPAGPAGAKCGLDDYLLRHTADDLRDLLAAAAPVPRPTIVIATDEHRVNDAAVK